MPPEKFANPRKLPGVEPESVALHAGVDDDVARGREADFKELRSVAPRTVEARPESSRRPAGIDPVTAPAVRSAEFALVEPDSPALLAAVDVEVGVGTRHFGQFIGGSFRCGDELV